MRFENVSDAVSWMEQKRRITKGLDHFHAYMNALGAPQDEFPCLHIAGTNGKGSVVNDLRSALQMGGYRVGTFTSPYLETHLDRIRINDAFMDQDAFLTLVNQHAEAWDAHMLNMFEMDMCLACLYFAKQQVDIAIFETGLGGEKDATNIVVPLLSAVTNIGMDHCELLGDTYAQIAAAKAGIMKPGVKFITRERKAECMNVFKAYAKQNRCEIISVNDPYIMEAGKRIRFSYRNIELQLTHQPLYQIENMCTAIEMLHHIKQEFPLDAAMIKKGLEAAQWKGRFEILQEEPLILLDGAHNEAGIHALCESLKPYHDLHILFSALQDKNSTAMIHQLMEICEDVIICEFDCDRAAKGSDIANGLPVCISSHYQTTIRRLYEEQKNIVVTGSLYFISEVRAFLLSFLKEQTKKAQ